MAVKKTARMVREEIYQIEQRELKEFSDMVRGNHPNVESYRQYVLAELRLARRRAVLLVKEIEHIGFMLAKNLVEPDTAVEWLGEANALQFLVPTEPTGSEEHGQK